MSTWPPIFRWYLFILSSCIVVSFYLSCLPNVSLVLTLRLTCPKEMQRYSIYSYSIRRYTVCFTAHKKDCSVFLVWQTRANTITNAVTSIMNFGAVEVFVRPWKVNTEMGTIFCEKLYQRGSAKVSKQFIKAHWRWLPEVLLCKTR